jgi:hypothetical protein
MYADTHKEHHMINPRNTIKAIALCLAAMLCGTVLEAQGKQTVAILQPEGNAAVTSMNKFNVRSALAAVLVATGKYDALDRNKIDQSLQEQNFQRGVLADSSKAKQVGKMLGADMICATELMKDGSEFVVEVSIIDVESGKIAHTDSEYLKNESNEAIRAAVQTLVGRMLNVGGTTTSKATTTATAPAATGIAAQIRNGEKRNLQFGQYKWRVLEVLRDKALIITEDVIEVNRAYHSTKTKVTWESCDLRRYLNRNFLQKFSEAEERMILNPNNPTHGTNGGSDTNDRIFLLSIQEARSYFSSNSDRKAGNSRWWWLRSPGTLSGHAAVVGVGGGLISRGGYVDGVDPFGGLRPALWLNLYSAIF